MDTVSSIVDQTMADEADPSCDRHTHKKKKKKKKCIIYVQVYSFDNWQNVDTYFEKNKI